MTQFDCPARLWCYVVMYRFTEFTEATRITGGLSKHRHKAITLTILINKVKLTMCFRLQFPFQTIFKFIIIIIIIISLIKQIDKMQSYIT